MWFITSESQFWLFIIFYVNIINHYTVSTTGWRRNENAKYLRALTIYLLSESFFFFFQSSIERNWAIRNLLWWKFGGGHGDLRCCHGVAYLFCAAMRWIKSHLAACGVSDIKLTVFGEKKQLAHTLRYCGLSYGRSYYKTEEPGLLISTTTRWT